MPEPDPETLRQALEAYIAARPDLSEQTAGGYREILERGFLHQMDQPVALLVTAEILRLNTEHLETLTRNDPTNKPPVGFWAWQSVLRALRAVLGWSAAQKDRPSPWPSSRALKIPSGAGVACGAAKRRGAATAHRRPEGDRKRHGAG